MKRKGNPWHDKLGRFCHGPEATEDTWGNPISDERKAVIYSQGRKIDLSEMNELRDKYNIPYTVKDGNIHFGLEGEPTPHYIRCGGFDKEKIEGVANKNNFNKPFGGVWLSASDAKFGWNEWVEAEGMTGWNENPTKVVVNGARIVHIYDTETIDKLPKTSDGGIDFERLSEDFDGIELHLSESRKGVTQRLYGWDCDSTLFFNPDVF